MVRKTTEHSTIFRGHFTAEKRGQFAVEWWGHLRAELVGHYPRILHAMTDKELWELYERLNDENRILHNELGDAIIAANEGLILTTSRLLMQSNKEDKLRGLEKLNLNETQVKSLYIIACRNEHFEVCFVLKEKYGDILTKTTI